MNDNKITYKKIAELSQVAVGTVSRYFHNYNISNNAKEKISKVLSELDYIPNYSASMIKKENNDIYLILPYNANWKASSEIMDGAKKSLESNKINLFVFISSEDTKQYIIDLKELLKRNPKGIILLLPKKTDNELIEIIKKNKSIKKAIYNRIEFDNNENIKGILIDDTKMFEEVTKVAIKDLKNKIGYIGLDESDVTTGLNRKKGFLQALKNKNIKFEIIELKNNNIELAYNATRQLYESGCDLIVCGTHTINLAATKYILDNKLVNKLFLTDVGTNNIHSTLLKSKYYIFIDYFFIGMILADIIKNKNNEVRRNIEKFKIIIN